ncbi:MAG: hypothetical protein ACKVS9_07000 [Phycisphaerae bacterium]
MSRNLPGSRTSASNDTDPVPMTASATDNYNRLVRMFIFGSFDIGPVAPSVIE